MANQDLFFNILTFEPQNEKLTFYFTTDEDQSLHRMHFNLLPKDVVSALSKLNPDVEHAFTSFTDAKEGLTPFELNVKDQGISLKKRYYGWKLAQYFTHSLGCPVKQGFIEELQIWEHRPKESNSQFNIYYKYSIKVQALSVSNKFELHLSFDGRSKVFKKNSVQLTHEVGSDKFNWVLYQNELHKWKDLSTNPEIKVKYEEVYPILNRELEQALQLPIIIPRPDNKYKNYLELITAFKDNYLATDEFQDVVPLDSLNFLKVPTTKIFKTSYTSNQLEFGRENGERVVHEAPKYALKDAPPFQQSNLGDTTMFFIMHRDDVKYAYTIKDQFENGFHSFKGLHQYVDLVLNVQKGLSIVFDDKENPLPEIEQGLAKADFQPGITYVAIYLTPIDKYTQDREQRKVYHRVKELLLKKEITSQAINPAKMVEQKDNWKYSLPNIAIALLAKLDGVPWRLNIPVKKDLIVGVGAFKHQEENTQYIGSSFSFQNDGRFNEFQYYLKDEMDVLAGHIAESVKQYATLNKIPSRLIIHFYKTMSDKELKPIMDELDDLGLGDIPVFIVTINKTESEDIVAFDKNWYGRMPESGTIIGIGYNKYLLFNNTRYGNSKVTTFDGFPFPVKLKIKCSQPELEEDVKVIKELIDQVYQFSRMYWKSLRQQNLPVTIKYPEMVAQIAPYFEDPGIPPFGKRNLWFL